uniref:Uncharacterized protein n=1 Tax=Sphaerodactylus townsendi TaxID=933632 RepID=A0ACB8FU66_9SAUR
MLCLDSCTEVVLLQLSAIQKLGPEIFEKVYKFLKEAKQENASEDEIKDYLERVVCKASDCFEVDQLLYFEDQLCPQRDSVPQNRPQNGPTGIQSEQSEDGPAYYKRDEQQGDTDGKESCHFVL